MRVLWPIVFLTVICNIDLKAQGENNNWAFGNGGGLNFSSGSPVFFKTSMYSREGCAAISDAFGNLLFYTSGNMIWDKNGKSMPHGNILGNSGTGSATQGALILKSVSNAKEFYVFTLDASDRGINTKLRYSIVNMDLNNGLGDVRLDAKDIVLDDEMEERMFAVQSDDCGYWIVAHKRNSAQYVSFKLASSGVMPPVYSPGLIQSHPRSGDIGELKVSPDTRRIALMFRYNSAIELSAFDNITGVISNSVLLDSNTNSSFNTYDGYGLSFSPDNKRLYATLNNYSDLVQYDMSLYPNLPAIRSSKQLIAGGHDVYGFVVGMRIGSDGKIYIVNVTTGYVFCIKDPDNLGLSCNLDTQSVFMPPSVYFRPGLYGENFGNPTVTITYKDTLPGRSIDTIVCLSDSILLSVEANLLGYTWNDGVTGASRYAHEDGMYYCLSIKECTMRMDTFKVQFIKGHLQMGVDTIICPGDSLVLQVSGDGFRWQDGSTDSVYVIRNAGVYSVSINERSCSFSDSIKVVMYQPGAFIAEGDTLICKGEGLVLHGFSKPEGRLTWSIGGDWDSVSITLPGLYVMEAENICGTFLDSVYVDIQDCDCVPFMPNAFSPNGDGHNDFFKPVFNCYTSGYSLSVHNRYGQRIFSSPEQERGWDGIFNGKPSDSGTYFYYLQYDTPNGTNILRKGDLVLIR